MTATFKAEIADGGYRIDLPTSGAAKHLNRRIVPVHPERPPRIEEIAEGALFLRFAELPPALPDSQWLAFAGRYGRLGLAEHDEAASSWRFYITSMRGLVAIWHALRHPTDASRNYFDQIDHAAGTGQLSEFVGLLDNDARRNQYPEQVPDDADLDDLPGQMFMPPIAAVPPHDDEPEGTGEKLGRAYAGHALADEVTWAIREGYVEHIQFDEADGTFSVERRAPRLIDHLYRQLANSLVSPPEFLRCSSCAQWMAIGPGERTARAKYCDEACRQRAQRQRRKNAIALYREGVPVDEIAKHLSSSVPSVRSWIAAARGKSE